MSITLVSWTPCLLDFPSLDLPVLWTLRLLLVSHLAKNISEQSSHRSTTGVNHFPCTGPSAVVLYRYFSVIG